MKKNFVKAMALTMTLTMLGTTAAFAVDTLPAQDTATTTEVTEATEAEAAQVAFLSQTGVVTEVDAADENGNVIVTMDNENGGLRFVISATTTLVDRTTNAVVTAETVTKGMSVAVIFDANNPMGMSMPPYMGNVAAVVTNADKGSVAVGSFDEELTDMNIRLQLNIDETTKILNTNGTRQIMAAEDVMGQNAVVFYDFTTRSIPAQTTPSFVLVLNPVETVEAEEVAAVEITAEAVAEAPESRTASCVPLREMAEKAGFLVKWQGKENPILLEKDGVSMEITMGEATYTVNGEAVEASAKAELRNGVMFVASDIFA